MRADRLIAELLLLQTRGKVSAAEMAQEMEVSQRTIYRDMLALNTAGIPIYAENGSDGGYRLVDGYRTQLTGLSTGELQALFSMNIPAILGELGMDAAGKTALQKLQASLSTRQSQDSDFLSQRFLYDPTRWEPASRNTAQKSIREKLQQAIWQDQRIEITVQYWYRPGKLQLKIAPYAFVLKGNQWYVVYQREQSFRIHSLEGIITVTDLGERFEREPDFNLRQCWMDWCRIQQGQARHYPVVIRLKETALPAFSNQLQSHVLRTEPAEQGWLRIECVFDRLEEARSKLLAWGGAIQVVSPSVLKISMVDFAQQFLQQNHN